MSRAPKIIELNAPRHSYARNPLFVGEHPIDEPACRLDIDDPSSAFAQYLMPRLKDGRDEASKEVLAFLKSGESLGDAVAFTIQSLSESKTKKLRAWIEEAYGSRFYPYATIGASAGGVSNVGIMLTVGGPRDTVLTKKHIRNWNVDADAFEFMSASRFYAITRGSNAEQDLREMLHDPYALRPEVMEKKTYDDALTLLGITQSGWKNPGLYDFKKSPPAYLGSRLEYEYAVAFREAQQAIAEMYDDASALAWACENLRAQVKS